MNARRPVRHRFVAAVAGKISARRIRPPSDAHTTDTHHCTHLVKVDANGKAKINPDGSPVFSTDRDLSPMVKWIGYSVYRADRPADPEHLADYWVADNGQLIKFESAPKGKADVIMSQV